MTEDFDFYFYYEILQVKFVKQNLQNETAK